jgi:hypothetical protein
MPSHSWTGRCLCGAVRYECRADPIRTSLCHCEDCRRASGAPAVAWTFFPAASFRFIQGSPRSIAWAGRTRTFCSLCGSPLTFSDPSTPQFIEVTTATLDRADALSLDDHNWTTDRLPWFDTRDSAPRYPHNTP